MNPHPAQVLALAAGQRLARPEDVPAAWRERPWWRQSLAHGIPGIALLHVELAAAGLAPWQRAHDWLAAATAGPVTAGADSHPFYGAPALAHVLARAAEAQPGICQRALDTLDAQVTADAWRRLDAAHRRIDDGALPALAEFDALQGLTGYGAYLLHRDRTAAAVRGVLGYLVRLTEPVATEDGELPGWWTRSGPSGRDDQRFPGGHSNHGMAHGISGVLALLAHAARRGVSVPGQFGAIRALRAWLDRWTGPSTPYWITLGDLAADRLPTATVARPSWCYGAAGTARALQLAALALGETDRQLHAERTLLTALADPAQLCATTDPSLCHGFAGLAHTAARAAADAHPGHADRLRALSATLLESVRPEEDDPRAFVAGLLADPQRGPGLLDGAAGIALAGLSPATVWDACLVLA